LMDLIDLYDATWLIEPPSSAVYEQRQEMRAQIKARLAQLEELQRERTLGERLLRVIQDERFMQLASDGDERWSLIRECEAGYPHRPEAFYADSLIGLLDITI
jgi:hypothetical protein